MSLAAAVTVALVCAFGGSSDAAPTAADDPVLWQQLQAADRDNDGRLVPREFDGVGGSALWAALDVNKDNIVTLDEARANLPGFLARRAAIGITPRSSTGLVPLTDLRTGTYKGKEGGLYPGGHNDRPATHEEAGLRLARSIQPVDEGGRPAPTGKIGFVSIGMSNTTQEFSTFKAMADTDPTKNPRVVIVDGAQGAMTANVVSRPGSPMGTRFWETVDQRLRTAGVSLDQVQVVWIKEADPAPTGTKLEHVVTLESELQKIVQLLKQRFPNLTLCYLSSRIYGGYASTGLNPEPFAYEEGFAVKWLIEKQINGERDLNFDPARGAIKAPWLAWGPYLWADGQTPRSDGLTYDRADLRPDDGTHPSIRGRQKVAMQLLDFLKHDATARIWFLAGPR
jgi:hypothetical protein